MLYHLPFRDWMELDHAPAKADLPVEETDEDRTAAIATGPVEGDGPRRG